MPVQGAFGSDDVLPAAESFNMGLSDVGDESEIRIGNAAEKFYFPGVAGPHLNNSEFCILVHGQQGQRDSDMIVQIAFCSDSPVFFAEDGAAEFLGGGFTVGSGNSKNGDTQFVPVQSCDVLKGFQGVLYREDLFPLDIPAFRYDGGSPLFKSGADKFIAVEILSFQGKKDVPVRYCPCICGDMMFSNDTI